MTSAFRIRFTGFATAGFAVAYLWGNAVTPVFPEAAAARLDAMAAENLVLLNSVYAARMLTFVLVTPTLVGALRLLPARGARLGYVASALLLVGHIAEAPVISLVAVQFNVLAPAPDRQAAVTAAELIQHSSMWYVLGAISLIGAIVGFILLGGALWRAGTLPRWAAACISLGLVIHFVGGDFRWTAAGGILVLAFGLGALARAQLATTTNRPTNPTKKAQPADPPWQHTRVRDRHRIHRNDNTQPRKFPALVAMRAVAAKAFAVTASLAVRPGLRPSPSRQARNRLSSD
jgi:hypothetical protein